MSASKPSPFSPVQIVHDAGGHSSGWAKVGDGPWSGTVFLEGGTELTVEELTDTWKVIDETSGKSATGRNLTQLLRKIITAGGVQ